MDLKFVVFDIYFTLSSTKGILFFDHSWTFCLQSFYCFQQTYNILSGFVALIDFFCYFGCVGQQLCKKGIKFLFLIVKIFQVTESHNTHLYLFLIKVTFIRVILLFSLFYKNIELNVDLLLYLYFAF